MIFKKCKGRMPILKLKGIVKRKPSIQDKWPEICGWMVANKASLKRAYQNFAASVECHGLGDFKQQCRALGASQVIKTYHKEMTAKEQTQQVLSAHTEHVRQKGLLHIKKTDKYIDSIHDHIKKTQLTEKNVDRFIGRVSSLHNLAEKVYRTKEEKEVDLKTLNLMILNKFDVEKQDQETEVIDV